jgi:GDP-D-mannose dehydratase
VGYSFKEPVETGDVTGLAVVRILEAIKNYNPRIKFYQASTSELFGNVNTCPQNENTLMHPTSPYAIAKHYAYQMVKLYREAYGMYCVNGILFNHECISEDTPIILRNKQTNLIDIKKIKEIRKIKENWSIQQQWKLKDLEIWDGDNFVSLNLITATKRKKDNINFNCRLINTRHGIITVTNHHNMLDNNIKKIKAEKIKLNDKLYHKEYPIVPGVSLMTLEEAEFLGLMVGDGYISEDGKANFSNNNPSIMERFQWLWRSISTDYSKTEEYKTECGRTTRAILSGNPDYLRFIYKEVYTIDKYKRVPKKILNSSKEVQLAFLKGYNKADGLKANRCTYEFKNFKTNSEVLAQGLLFLISNTTSQDYNITFEKDEKYKGYYSINLLTPISNGDKETKVKSLLNKNYSQRGINKELGISRTFIRNIQQGGHATTIHPLSKNKEEVKKILLNQDSLWVYDIETSSGKFMGGVGTITVSNSPRRPQQFVTRKITMAVAEIKKGKKKDKLILGNTESMRDWGYAKEYVEAMWLMMKQKTPKDYVIGTGKMHSVKDFLVEAFEYADLDWKEWVETSDEFKRPSDVNQLQADASKARKELKWEPKTDFKQLVRLMVDADLKRIK